MRLQGVHALPLLDHQKRVRAPFGLERQCVLRVHGGAVLDAALFGPDRGDIGAEMRQDRIALAGLGGDDGDDMNHAGLPGW